MDLPKNKDQIISKPLYAYLAESLNSELINVILQGITKFADKDYLDI